MHTPAHGGLPWFPFHLDVILSPRDPGTTSLELAEPRAANFSGFCQVSFQRMCGDAKAPALILPDTDSKQRDGRQGEAVKGQRPFLSSLLLHSDLDAPVWQGEGRRKQSRLPPGRSI